MIAQESRMHKSSSIAPESTIMSDAEKMAIHEPMSVSPTIPGSDEADGLAEHFPDDDNFRMYEFKIKKCPCTRPHDWTQCPFVHPGERARRRCPIKYNYSATPCPDFKRNACKKGDNCDMAHGVFEVNLHPDRYRTTMCTDATNCTRKICFFAHKPCQLRYCEGTTTSTQQNTQTLSNNVPTSSAVIPQKQQQLAQGLEASHSMTLQNVSIGSLGRSPSNHQQTVNAEKVPIHINNLSEIQQMSNQVMYLQQRLLQEQNYAQQLLAFSNGVEQSHQQNYMRARLDSSTSSNERDPSSRHSSVESSWQEPYNMQLMSAVSKAFAQQRPQPNAMNRSRSEVALEENLMNGQCMVDDLISK